MSGLTFQLKDGSGAVVDFDAGPAPTSIKLGNLGLDLVQAALDSDPQTLHLDLTTSYTKPAAQALGAHTFGGAGGAGISLSAASAPSGDGKSGASSYGGTGGFGAGTEIKATFTSDAHGDRLHRRPARAGRWSVVISADANTDLSSNANTGSGGAFQVGLVRASTVTSAANTTAYVGQGTTINAGDDVIVVVNSNHKVDSVGRATGGGFISANDSETSAKVTFANNAYISDGATVTAVDAIGIYALSTARGTNDVYAESWGVGAGADADNTHNGDDAGVHITGTTRTRIGEGVDDHGQLGRHQRPGQIR